MEEEINKGSKQYKEMQIENLRKKIKNEIIEQNKEINESIDDIFEEYKKEKEKRITEIENSLYIIHNKISLNDRLFIDQLYEGIFNDKNENDNKMIKILSLIIFFNDKDNKNFINSDFGRLIEIKTLIELYNQKMEQEDKDELIDIKHLKFNNIKIPENYRSVWNYFMKKNEIKNINEYLSFLMKSKQELYKKIKENIYDDLFNEVLHEKIKKQLEKKENIKEIQSEEIDENDVIDLCLNFHDKGLDINLNDFLDKNKYNIPLIFVRIKNNKNKDDYDAICLDREILINYLSDHKRQFFGASTLTRYIEIYNGINVEYNDLINAIKTEHKIFYLKPNGSLQSIITYEKMLTDEQEFKTKNIYSFVICSGKKCNKTNPPKGWFSGWF